MESLATGPRNNAFGLGSPSWNLSFPAGNLTAAEILAYLPHWLKSIDVVDRFITNGGRSATIVAMINEFRNLPGGVMLANSVQIMMSYQMRHAGYKNWTVGTHSKLKLGIERVEDDLYVGNFRPPRITHPRGGKHNFSHNNEARPIPFKNLALHVRKHPKGNDALDLTRCVLYALAHEEETWLFPTDFARLVNHLGGSHTVTHSHLDKNAFARCEAALALVLQKFGKSTPASRGKHKTTDTNMPATRIEKALLMARSTTTKRSTSYKRENELNMALAGNKRRSSRLVGKKVNMREDDSDAATEKDFIDSPYSNTSKPNKRRKISRCASPVEAANDSDFVQDESEPDDDIPEADDVLEDDEVSPSKARKSRAAAHKARATIKAAFIPERSIAVLSLADMQRGCGPFKLPEYMTKTYSPEIMEAARKHSSRVPEFLNPPVLSKNRLRVDESSIFLYAADGCVTRQEMWNSALSSTRFNGPRRSAPYRELYRLTDPCPHDESDWAENIRWAKEQYKTFGSDTWTEYDYHLEQITEARRSTLWVSEEAIRAGMQEGDLRTISSTREG